MVNFIRSLCAVEIIKNPFVFNNPGFLGDGDRRFLAIHGFLKPREKPHFAQSFDIPEI